MSADYYKIKCPQKELFNNSEFIYIIVNNCIDHCIVLDKDFNYIIGYSEFENDNDDMLTEKDIKLIELTENYFNDYNIVDLTQEELRNLINYRFNQEK